MKPTHMSVDAFLDDRFRKATWMSKMIHKTKVRERIGFGPIVVGVGSILLLVFILWFSNHVW